MAILRPLRLIELPPPLSIGTGLGGVKAGGILSLSLFSIFKSSRLGSEEEGEKEQLILSLATL